MIGTENIFSLNGQVALLTGASGHLGSAMAMALGSAGAHVILAGRQLTRLTALQQSLHARGYRSEILILDVTNETELRDAMTRVTSTHSSLNILVNNAYGLSVTDNNSTNFHGAYEVTVVAAQRLIELALPLLQIAANDGNASIINIASMYGTVSPDLRIYTDAPLSPSFYGASKAALIQLTRYLACQLAPHAIRVNSISPGPFPSRESQEKFPEMIKALNTKVPAGRIGKPEELGGALVFLASQAASYITGINLPVDGGWTAW